MGELELLAECVPNLGVYHKPSALNPQSTGRLDLVHPNGHEALFVHPGPSVIYLGWTRQIIASLTAARISKHTQNVGEMLLFQVLSRARASKHPDESLVYSAQINAGYFHHLHLMLQKIEHVFLGGRIDSDFYAHLRQPQMPTVIPLCADPAYALHAQL